MHIRHRRYHFGHFASTVSWAVGHPFAFGLALLGIFIWLVTGPFAHFSSTWQLIINTTTTIITFLMVFVLQNTQNRESHAIHLKLDEIIRALQGAHLAVLDLEELSDAELAELRQRYCDLAKTAREEMRHGKRDTGSPEVDLTHKTPRKRQP